MSTRTPLEQAAQAVEAAAGDIADAVTRQAGVALAVRAFERAVRHHDAEIVRAMDPFEIALAGQHARDDIAHRWALANEPHGVRYKRMPADWDHCTPRCQPSHRRIKRPGDTLHPGHLPDYCPAAGPRRNQTMVDRRPAVCLGFPMPGSRGTADCMRRAAAAGIPVRRWPPPRTGIMALGGGA